MANPAQNDFKNEKLATLWRQLSWSHNRTIMALKNTEEREYYAIWDGGNE